MVISKLGGVAKLNMSSRRKKYSAEDIAKEFVRSKCDQDGFEIRLLEEKGNFAYIVFIQARI